MGMMALDPALLSRYPAELSGGQAQRVGVARAFAADPPVLLMDEPFGAVDPVNRAAIQAEFVSLQRRLRKTVVFVSHDLDEALKLGDRIAIMREGRLVQCDTPDAVLARPADEFVAEFVGGDRTLRRLRLMTVADALAPEGIEAHARVPDGSPSPRAPAAAAVVRPEDDLRGAASRMLSLGLAGAAVRRRRRPPGRPAHPRRHRPRARRGCLRRARQRAGRGAGRMSAAAAGPASTAVPALRAARWPWLAGGGVLAALFAALATGAPGLVAELATYGPDLAVLGRQHLYLVAVSAGLAVLTGVPLGILLSRERLTGSAEWVMQLLNVGSTVPTLAVLALSMGLLGIGTPPALFALWLATLLPITRNAYAGLRGVPPALNEAATGMGMTPAQRLLRVELPYAAPVLFAGLRTAVTVNVATAPLASLIGGGGLGDLIFAGIQLYDPAMMLAGALATALLALAADGALAWVQRMSVPRGLRSRAVRV
jgi:osmoprotectant transport system permease protein